MTEEEKLEIVNEIKEELRKRDIPIVSRGTDLKSIPIPYQITTVINPIQ